MLLTIETCEVRNVREIQGKRGSFQVIDLYTPDGDLQLTSYEYDLRGLPRGEKGRFEVRLRTYRRGYSDVLVVKDPPMWRKNGAAPE